MSDAYKPTQEPEVTMKAGFAAAVFAFPFASALLAHHSVPSGVRHQQDDHDPGYCHED
jgi:hypothetical protein